MRFGQEVAGVMELGMLGRGEHSEITTFVGEAVSSELSGNMIDLCPVGALTSKPYAFTARPWELTKTETIDVMDALGSNIRVDVKGREVMRILPRNHDGVNEEWISDKTRFVWDGLRRQRLDKPYIREDGKLRPATWPEAFKAIAAKLSRIDGKRIGAIAGVAQIDRQPDGKATVWLDGSHMIDVAGALTEGQVVYIKTDRTLTATATGNYPFGVAVTAKGTGTGPAEVAPFGHNPAVAVAAA